MDVNLDEFCRITKQPLPFVLKEIIGFNFRFRGSGYKTKWKAEKAKDQEGKCPLCPEPLNGILEQDHIITMSEFANRAFSGEITLAEAAAQAWDEANLRVIHWKCNYTRNRKAGAA
jgi:5-methylcytosine-specific restriction endonuclease McrA